MLKLLYALALSQNLDERDIFCVQWANYTQSSFCFGHCVQSANLLRAYLPLSRLVRQLPDELIVHPGSGIVSSTGALWSANSCNGKSRKYCPWLHSPSRSSKTSLRCCDQNSTGSWPTGLYETKNRSRRNTRHRAPSSL